MVDRPNRRNNATFSSFCSVEWMLPKRLSAVYPGFMIFPPLSREQMVIEPWISLLSQIGYHVLNSS